MFCGTTMFRTTHPYNLRIILPADFTGRSSDCSIYFISVTYFVNVTYYICPQEFIKAFKPTTDL